MRVARTGREPGVLQDESSAGEKANHLRAVEKLKGSSHKAPKPTSSLMLAGLAGFEGIIGLVAQPAVSLAGRTARLPRLLGAWA